MEAVTVPRLTLTQPPSCDAAARQQLSTVADAVSSVAGADCGCECG